MAQTKRQLDFDASFNNVGSFKHRRVSEHLSHQRFVVEMINEEVPEVDEGGSQLDSDAAPLSPSSVSVASSDNCSVPSLSPTDLQDKEDLLLPRVASDVALRLFGHDDQELCCAVNPSAAEEEKTLQGARGHPESDTAHTKDGGEADGAYQQHMRMDEREEEVEEAWELTALMSPPMTSGLHDSDSDATPADTRSEECHVTTSIPEYEEFWSSECEQQQHGALPWDLGFELPGDDEQGECNKGFASPEERQQCEELLQSLLE